MQTLPAPDFDIEIDWNLASADPDNEPTAEHPVVPSDFGLDPEPTHVGPAPLPVSTFERQVMADQGAQDLIADERAILAREGLASKDDGELFYAAGTALAEVGHQNLTAYERAYQEMPGPADALEAFQRTITDEARADSVIDLVALRLNHEGRLAYPGSDAPGPRGWDVSRVAWRQLTEIAGEQNVNAGLGKRTQAVRRVRSRDNAERGREAFAIVSRDGYTVLDGPQVADMMVRALRAKGLDSGCKMDVQYDRETTRYQVRAIVQAPIDIPALWGVGRVHQAFIQVSGGDDGMTSLRGNAGAIRVRCLNASLAQLDGARWVQAHKGDLSRLASMVAGTVDQFGRVAESLRDAWSRAAANHYLNTDGTELSVTEALSRLVHHGHLPTGGQTAEEATDRYVQAWKAERDTPTSAAGILMAVQRAAHESTWASKWSTTEIEEAASDLLYQPVWQLAEVSA